MNRKKFESPKKVEYFEESATVDAIDHAMSSIGGSRAEYIRRAVAEKFFGDVANGRFPSLPSTILEYVEIHHKKKAEEEKKREEVISALQQQQANLEEQKKIAEDKEQFLKEKINPDIWYRKLPGNDIHGDYAEAWVDYAGRISRESGLDITVRDLQEYVKRSHYAGT